MGHKVVFGHNYLTFGASGSPPDHLAVIRNEKGRPGKDFQAPPALLAVLPIRFPVPPDHPAVIPEDLPAPPGELAVLPNGLPAPPDDPAVPGNGWSSPFPAS